MHYPSLTPARTSSSWAFWNHPSQQGGHSHGHRQGQAGEGRDKQGRAGTGRGGQGQAGTGRGGQSAWPPCIEHPSTQTFSECHHNHQQLPHHFVTPFLLQGARTRQQFSILCLFLFPWNTGSVFSHRVKEPEKLGEMATLGSSPREGCGDLSQCCRFRLPLPASGTSLALVIWPCFFSFLRAA